MKKAYIVLVHKGPEQVYRLISRLNDGNSIFFVHIDSKVNIKKFNRILEFGDKVKLLNRVDGSWGTFGIVRATLIGMRAVRASKMNFNTVSLISGQDYPLKANGEIDEFYKTSPHSVFVEVIAPLPINFWHKGGLSRVEKYFFGLEWYRRAAAKVANGLQRVIPPLRKKVPYGLKLYGGSQWWTMDMYGLNYILDYIDDHPKLLPFFRFALLGDEIIFQTIIMNSTDEKLRRSFRETNIRHIVIPVPQVHPIIWTKSDLPDLKNSGALFSRKFDVAVDAEVLDMIDRDCLAVKQP